MNSEAIGFLLFVGGLPVWSLLIWLNVPWRLASVSIPAGVLVGGLLSGMLSFLPRWGELAILIWFAAGMYAVLVLIGYIRKPFMENTGQRW